MDPSSKKKRVAPSIDVEYQQEDELGDTHERPKLMWEPKFEKRANSALEN